MQRSLKVWTLESEVSEVGEIRSECGVGGTGLPYTEDHKVLVIDKMIVFVRGIYK